MTAARYKAGKSGNPAGRAKGSKNKRTKLMEALEKDLPKLLKATKEKALEGDIGALRLLLERLIPAKKTEASTVTIKGLSKEATLTGKACAILDAIAAGEVPPDIGANLITALGATAKIIEMDELVKRLEVLENA